MEIFAKGTVFGSLQILEIYEYYDGPRLFACTNETGSLFLVLWVGTDGQSDRYYVAPMSFHRYRSVRSGALTLRDAFTRTEGNVVLLLRSDGITGEFDIEPMIREQLDFSVLPVKGEALGLGPPFPFVLHTATELKRHTVELAMSSELSFRQIGKVFSTFQRLLGSAASTFFDTPSRESRLSLISAGVGSFLVEASLPKAHDDAESEAQAQCLALVLKGLSGVDGGDGRSIALDFRVYPALKAFADVIATIPDGVHVSWASPELKKISSVAFPRERAKETRDRITEESRALLRAPITINESDRLIRADIPLLLPPERAREGFIVGVFKAIDLERRRFALYNPENDDIFRGVISRTAEEPMQNATMNRPYLVQISYKRPDQATLVRVEQTQSR